MRKQLRSLPTCAEREGVHATFQTDSWEALNLRVVVLHIIAVFLHCNCIAPAARARPPCVPRSGFPRCLFCCRSNLFCVLLWHQCIISQCAVTVCSKCIYSSHLSCRASVHATPYLCFQIACRRDKVHLALQALGASSISASNLCKGIAFGCLPCGRRPASDSDGCLATEYSLVARARLIKMRTAFNPHADDLP